MDSSEMPGNKNRIGTYGFSNPDTRNAYHNQASIPDMKQCGGCSFYAIFNEDYGLCCHREARFYLETVFEHFGCEKNIFEGWDAHSFHKDARQLPDREHLYGLLERCSRAIGGKKGMGIHSVEIRRLYLEIKAILKRRDGQGGATMIDRGNEES